MPVVPTYEGYAPAPNLAEAYLGRERLRQEAAADAARISLGYATLQQRAVESEMELAAQKEIASRQALMKAQEAEIENAYRNTQIGLAERRLKDDEAITQMRLNEAAANMDSRLKYQAAVEGGMDPSEAMRRFGFGQTGFGPAQERTSTPRVTASEKTLRYRELGRQASVIEDRWPGKENRGITPKDQKALDDIYASMNAMSVLPDRSVPTSQVRTPTVPLDGLMKPMVMDPPMPVPPQPGTGFIGAPEGTSSEGIGIPAGVNLFRGQRQNEVIRRDKTGRRAVFNADTKEFIRYAD